MSHVNFVYRRRVTFPEADPAGIAHFSNYPRWVEEAESAFWREHNVAVPALDAGKLCGFPKVAFSIRYRSPVRPGDEIVVSLRPEPLPNDVLKWHFSIRCDATLCATGELTVVYADANPLLGELRRLPLTPEMHGVLAA